MLDTQQDTDGQGPPECMWTFTFNGRDWIGLVSACLDKIEGIHTQNAPRNTVHKYSRRRIGDQETLLVPSIESPLQPWTERYMMWRSARPDQASLWLRGGHQYEWQMKHGE